MEAQTFLDNFATIADAPGGARRLRNLVLDLAVSGRVTEQDRADQPASTLIDQIRVDMDQLCATGHATPNRTHTPREPKGRLPAGWCWAYAPQLGFVNPRNQAIEDILAGFVPMPLVPTDVREPVRCEERRWSEISKGYTHIANGDIAVAKITPCFQNGKSAVIAGLPSGIGAATTELFVLRPTKGGVNPKYLHIFFRSPSYIDGGVPEMTGTAGQQRLPRQYFTDTPVPVPPLAEQERIVAKVDELMGLCDDLEARQERHHRDTTRFRFSALHAMAGVETSGELRQAWKRVSVNWPALTPTIGSLADLRGSILRLATMGWLTRQEADAGDAADELEKLRRDRQSFLSAELARGNSEAATMMRKIARLTEPDSPYPIPQGWTCTALIDLSSFLVDCHNKTAPYSRTGIPIVRTTNIKFGRLIWQDMKYVTNETYERWSQRLQPRPGDVLFTREAPMGEAAIIPPQTQICLGQRTMLIRPWPSAVLPEYLLIALREPGLLERSTHLSIGSTVKHFRVGDVERIPIMLPPIKEQKRIVQTVDYLLNLCDQLEATLGQHDELQMRLGAALTRT
jgi:type I restriction enzyme S subunit